MDTVTVMANHALMLMVVMKNMLTRDMDMVPLMKVMNMKRETHTRDMAMLTRNMSMITKDMDTRMDQGIVAVSGPRLWVPPY